MSTVYFFVFGNQILAGFCFKKLKLYNMCSLAAHDTSNQKFASNLQVAIVCLGVGMPIISGVSSSLAICDEADELRCVDVS